MISADASIELDPTSSYAVTGVRRPHTYDKGFFTTKLGDMAMLNDVEERVLARLQDRFTMAELDAAIGALDDDDGISHALSGETTRVLHWLASSNYRTSFSASVDLSERVLFPSGATESSGMEDARFVRFDDGGEILVTELDEACEAVADAGDLDRRSIRAAAVTRFDVSTMVDKYVATYRAILDLQFTH